MLMLVIVREWSTESDWRGLVEFTQWNRVI